MESGEIRAMNPTLAAAALGSMVEWTTFCYVELGEPAGPEATLDELAVTLTDLWFNAVYGKLGPGA